MTLHLGGYIKDPLCLVIPTQHRLMHNGLFLDVGRVSYYAFVGGVLGQEGLMSLLKSYKETQA
ncbi:rCG20547 [Rattus norvegicus]|uniref:RCG20547 n=1 Tax=Rattus norvegicus TaxID=10116 RepID=A6K5N7_RAT|nr:rCG20547 [Rattus norvegicus]